MRVKITETVEVTVRCTEQEVLLLAAAVAQALKQQNVEQQLVQLGTVQTTRILQQERVRNG